MKQHLKQQTEKQQMRLVTPAPSILITSQPGVSSSQYPEIQRSVAIGTSTPLASSTQDINISLQNLRNEMSSLIDEQGRRTQHEIKQLKDELGSIRLDNQKLRTELHALKDKEQTQQTMPSRHSKRTLEIFENSSAKTTCEEPKQVVQKKSGAAKKVKTTKSSHAKSMKQQGLFKETSTSGPQQGGSDVIYVGTQPSRSGNPFLELIASAVIKKESEEKEEYQHLSKELTNS